MITTLINVQYNDRPDRRTRSALCLGHQGENGARQIIFNLADMISDYGPGTVTMLHMRGTDPAPYIIDEAAVTAAAPTVTWTISDTDTAAAGYGLMELRLAFTGTGGESLAKSVLYGTVTYKALAGEIEIPSAMQAWYDALIDYIDTHSGGSVDPEDIAAAVEAYFVEHPITETDPTVPAWAKASTKPTYTASEVGALPDDTVIPTKTSDLTNDSGFITSAPVASVNGRTGAVTGLQEQTTVVNKTSSDTAQTLAANTFYVWPEMSALTITCPTTGGPFAFRFTSGATATTLSMTGITMPDDFTVEANKTYEINVYEGYGLAVSWEVSA